MSKLFFLTLLMATQAHAQIIWSPASDGCKLISGAYYQVCPAIVQPGRDAVTPPNSTETSDPFINSMTFQSRLIYTYACSGSAADETFLTHGGLTFPLVFGKNRGQIVHEIDYGDRTPYKLVRLSKPFTYVGLTCSIEIVSNDLLPSNLKLFKVYVQSVMRQDAFLGSAIDVATPGVDSVLLQSKLDQAKSNLSSMILITDDEIAKASLQTSLDAVTSAITQLTESCPIGSTSSCTQELGAVQTLLQTEATRLGTDIDNLSNFVKLEIARVSGIADSSEVIQQLNAIKKLFEVRP